MDITTYLWVFTGISLIPLPSKTSAFSKNCWLGYIYRLCLGLIAGWGLPLVTGEPYILYWSVAIKGAIWFIEAIAILWFKESSSEDVNGWDIFALLLSIVLIVAGLVANPIASRDAGLSNSNYFNTLVVTMPNGSLPYDDIILDNMVRLTTTELAQANVKSHWSNLGSDLEIASSHITMWENPDTHKKRQVWVCAITSTHPNINRNRIIGLMLVDVNNPEELPITVNQEFKRGEGLSWNFNTYPDGDMAKRYGRAYITQDEEGNWRTVVTRYIVDGSFVRKFNGVDVFDTEGNILGHYADTFEKLSEIPRWIVQPFDEQTFMEGGISDWGQNREEGNRIFLNTPEEDVRFIYEPSVQDVAAIAMVNPIGQEKDNLNLAGMFKFTRNGIFYYNLRQYQLISGERAIISVHASLGDLYKTSGYKGEMPLLYMIAEKFVWYVPIYYTQTVKESSSDKAEEVTIELKGISLVDAQTKATCTVLREGHMTGEDLVKRARISFSMGYIEKDVSERKQKIINYFQQDKNLIVNQLTNAPPYITSCKGTFNYTSFLEWNATTDFIDDFIGQYSNQKNVFVWTTDVWTENFGFLVPMEILPNENVWVVHYVSIALQ